MLDYNHIYYENRALVRLLKILILNIFFYVILSIIAMIMLFVDIDVENEDNKVSVIILLFVSTLPTFIIIFFRCFK